MSSPLSKKSSSSKFRGWQLLGLVAIALPTFHALSTLIFAVLGLSPSSKTWPLALTLATVLSVSGAMTGLQQLPFTKRLSTPMAIVSGLASGAVLGLFTAGMLSDQDTAWSVAGLVCGSLLLGGIAAWAYVQSSRGESFRGKSSYRINRFFCSAITLTGGLCAYAAAFGFGVWTWATLTGGQLGLCGLLALTTTFYLWCSRRAITLCARHLIR